MQKNFSQRLSHDICSGRKMFETVLVDFELFFENKLCACNKCPLCKYEKISNLNYKDIKFLFEDIHEYESINEVDISEEVPNILVKSFYMYDAYKVD